MCRERTRVVRIRKADLCFLEQQLGMGSKIKTHGQLFSAVRDSVVKAKQYDELQDGINRLGRLVNGDWLWNAMIGRPRDRKKR